MLILQKPKILLKMCNKKGNKKEEVKIWLKCHLDVYWGTMSQLDDNYDKYGRV